MTFNQLKLDSDFRALTIENRTVSVIMKSFLGVSLIWLSVFLVTIVASPGDNLEAFWECNEVCEFKNHCNDAVPDLESNYFARHEFEETPLLLSSLLFWDCTSNCDYQCQQVVTKLRISNAEEIYQFHGKWPFIRMFSFQEMFSTLFSMGNFFPHYYGYLRLTKAISNYKFYNRESRITLYLVNYTYVAIAGMFAWTASTIFHWRDLLITEKFDYFFAGMTVLVAFHAIFSRIFRLEKYPKLAKLFFFIVVGIFSMHILRLYIDWSYTYNMRFNVCFGLLQYILIIIMAYQNYRTISGSKQIADAYITPSDNHIFKLCIVPILLVTGIVLAMSLELVDFFSWDWQIDAHALWHFCTILPSWVLYDFFLNDFNYMVAKENID